MENAVIYARYSSSKQGEQSIEGQLAAAHTYADAKGYNVIHEYIDRAQSGRSDNRDQFQQMLSDSSKKQFQVIVVWKVDRFGRNREEITFNKYRVKRNGVRVEYVAENLPDSPESVILESVLEGMAEYYSLQLSQNVKRGMYENAKKGKYSGGSVPLGYALDDEKRFVVNPDKAPIVTEAFKRYAAGETIAELIEDFNSRGLTTYRGNKFTKNSLRSVLKNEKYIGIYDYKNGEIRLEDVTPVLIDKETFNRVQIMLKENKKAPAHKWARADYLLTGKLYCGHCGCPMTGFNGTSKNGGTYCYYACTGRKKKNGCSKKPVRKDWIEKIVIDEVITLLNSDESVNEMIEIAWNVYSADSSDKEKLRALTSQLDSVEKALKNILKAIEMGIINETTQDRMRELDAQKQALKKSIAETRMKDDMHLSKSDFEKYFRAIQQMDQNSPEGQKYLIQSFVDRIYVFDDYLDIHFRSINKDRVKVPAGESPSGGSHETGSSSMALQGVPESAETNTGLIAMGSSVVYRLCIRYK